MKINFFILFIGSCFWLLSCTTNQPRNSANAKIEAVGKMGYQKINLDRGLTYYYLPSEKSTDPLIIMIQGSGCDSHFSKDNAGIIYSNFPAMVGRPFKGKAAILAVEKPGVSTFDENQKSDVSGCTNEFRNTFTFDTWIKNLATAAEDVKKRYQLNPTKLIIIGHSEGSDSAAMLAGTLKDATHVICMSGGSGSPVFQSVLRAVRGAKTQAEADLNTRSQLKVWTDAVAKNDPNALLWGHTFRYWKSRPATADFLSQSKAKVLLVYGTNDDSSPAVTSELLASELAVLGKRFDFIRKPDADHSYTVKGEEHMDETIIESLNWALLN